MPVVPGEADVLVVPSRGLDGAVAVTVPTACIEPRAVAEARLVDVPSIVVDFLADPSPDVFVRGGRE